MIDRLPFFSSATSTEAKLIPIALAALIAKSTISLFSSIFNILGVPPCSRLNFQSLTKRTLYVSTPLLPNTSIRYTLSYSLSIISIPPPNICSYIVGVVGAGNLS